MKVLKSKNRVLLRPELGDRFDDFMAAIVDAREHAADDWLLFVTPGSQVIAFMSPELAAVWNDFITTLQPIDRPPNDPRERRLW